MKTPYAAFLIAFGILSLPAAWAVDDLDGPPPQPQINQEDFIIFNRNRCLAERASAAGSGAATSTNCARLTSAQSTFTQEMGRRFCEKPEDFCRTYREMQTAEYVGLTVYSSSSAVEEAQRSGRGVTLGGAWAPTGGVRMMDRTRTMVGPRCEAASRPNTGSVTPHQLGFTSRNRMLALWGCGPMGFPRSGTSGFTYETSCDTSKIPFNCATGAVTSPALNPGAGATAAINSSIRALRPRLVGGRCVIGAAALNIETNRMEPFTCPNSEPVGGDCQEALTSNLEGSLSTLGDRLYGTGSRRFRDSSRMIFNEEMPNGQTAAQMVQGKFDAAKRGVLRYLEQIGAPADAIALVRDTSFESPLDLLRPTTSAADAAAQSEKWNALEQDCRHNHNQGMGYSNAFNTWSVSWTGSPAHSRHTINHKITICPSQLLDAVRGNPKSLLTLFGHELGHSIDPCGLTMRKTYVGGDRCSSAPRPPLAAPAAFSTFLRSESAFISCLQDNSRMERAGENWPHSEIRRPTHGTFWQRLLDASPAVLNATERCQARAHMDPDNFGACAKYPTREQLNRLPLNAADKQRLLADWEGSQASQSGESFADVIGAESFAFSAEEDDSEWRPGGGFDREQKLADVLTSVASQCGGATGASLGWSCSESGGVPCGTRLPDTDPHPADQYRVSLYAGATNLRAAVCRPQTLAPGAQGNGTQLPSAGCQMRRPAAGAATDSGSPWFRNAAPAPAAPAGS